jgi:hypothetical protein
VPDDLSLYVRVDFRAPADLIALLDEWRRHQPDLPTRTEALRRLVARALDAETVATPTRRQGGARP